MEEKMSDQQPVSAKNYLGLEEEYSNLKKAKVAMIQVPYDKTATYLKGTRMGPSAIIEASKKLELFDDELNQETYRIGIHTAEPLAVEESAPEEMVEKVYSATLELLKVNKFPALLGGEHSLSPGAVRALKEVYPNISVLHLDAHYDLQDEYYGSKNNHGCAARRMSEICPISQVGVRSMSKKEKDFLASQTPGRINTMSVYDILETPMWKDKVTRSLTENVYVSIDLDVFDPAVMPGVGTPEPGGLGWYETIDLLKDVSKDRKIVGFDVVELCPIKGQVASDFFAAKLIYRLLGYIFNKK